MRCRSFIGGLGTTAFAGSVASPRLAGAQSAKPLRFVPASDLAVIDAIWTLAYVTRTHGFLAFDTLYGLDEGFAPQPQMVAGHSVEANGKLWTLTRRDGLSFHDSSRVLAEDCIASVVAMRAWPKASTVAQAFAKGSPFRCAMMPARLAATPPATQLTEMVGSGPFRFVAKERVPGSLAVCNRFRELRAGARSIELPGRRDARAFRAHRMAYPARCRHGGGALLERQARVMSEGRSRAPIIEPHGGCATCREPVRREAT
ncbi:hypothetical protein AB4099_27745 [Bosea sp. 2KB_26]|uniref:hypothetical protein n=1 Tax=Bosea sp. 2KB_26 TaxID=3237475 RepID=UPI003F913597